MKTKRKRPFLTPDALMALHNADLRLMRAAAREAEAPSLARLCDLLLRQRAVRYDRLVGP